MKKRHIKKAFKNPRSRIRLKGLPGLLQKEAKRTHQKINQANNCFEIVALCCIFAGNVVNIASRYKGQRSPTTHETPERMKGTEMKRSLHTEDGVKRERQNSPLLQS